MNILVKHSKAYLKDCEYKDAIFRGVDLKEYTRNELMKIIVELEKIERRKKENNVVFSL